MIRKCVTICFILLIFNISALNVSACSSFAIYADKTFYGMNWDYNPDVDAYFSISSEGDTKVFTLNALEGFQPVGVNTKGMFAARLTLYPEEEFYINEDGSDTIDMFDLFRKALDSSEEVGQIVDYLQNKRITYSAEKFHNMIADKSGNAIIVEVGKEGNEIIRNKENFAVMTNFSNSLSKDVKYTDVSGIGSDRYYLAYDYLLKHRDKFNIENGFELLNNIVCLGTYQTRCSMLFDPTLNEVYIAVEMNFDKIWKISLKNETIETYKGFAKALKLPVEGLCLSDLKKLSDKDNETLDKYNDKHAKNAELKMKSSPNTAEKSSLIVKPIKQETVKQEKEIENEANNKKPSKAIKIGKNMVGKVDVEQSNLSFKHIILVILSSVTLGLIIALIFVRRYHK